VPDDDGAHAVLKAMDAEGAELAQVHVAADFKLNPGSASAWIDSGYLKPR
jgi:hypothetical protein